MAGTASLAAAPGGAAVAAAAPSAGSVPPPLGAPVPGGGPDGARPSNGRETEPAEANEPHTRHAGAVDARPLHSSDTFVTSSWALACSHMHTPKSHAHDRHLSTHTSITPSHTRTHLPGCQWSHVDAHGGRLSELSPRIRQPSLSSAAPRPYAPCSVWPPPVEV